MKLLFDENPSRRLVRLVSERFPDSAQAVLLRLESASDEAIWEFARDRGFTIVTKDTDFADLSRDRGGPRRSFGFVSATLRPLKLRGS